jgi:hypothetical protein
MTRINRRSGNVEENMNTLAVYEFLSHLRQEGFTTMVSKGRASAIDDATPIVIRGAHGDFAVAAVHFDAGRLVIDMGHPLDERRQP